MIIVFTSEGATEKNFPAAPFTPGAGIQLMPVWRQRAIEQGACQLPTGLYLKLDIRLDGSVPRRYVVFLNECPFLNGLFPSVSRHRRDAALYPEKNLIYELTTQ